MIKIYILDAYGADGEEMLTSALPDYIRETKNKRQRRERIFAYMLLSYAFSDFTRSSLPEIIRDSYGRPSAEGAGVDFNISHDNDVIALIISDEGRVGIDVQSHSFKTSERIVRFTKEICEGEAFLKERTGASELSRCFVKRLCYAEDKGIYPSENNELSPPDKASVISDWTLIEALVKCDGRGLQKLKDAFEILAECKTFERSFISRNGESYALSAVLKKEPITH